MWVQVGETNAKSCLIFQEQAGLNRDRGANTASNIVNNITQADNDELGLGLSINRCEEPSIVTNEPSIPQLSSTILTSYTQIENTLRIARAHYVLNSLPDNEDIPHCFLPVSLWLDKGNITKRVKKHPIIIRPVFLPHQVRNASGNGGGVLVGYMPIWQCFKREVYHKVAKQVYKNSIEAPNKTEAERILQSYGLHATENFFWTLEHSDPYLAISYDKLH
ncbi:hypothetical protein SERLADRAFT_417905, partial [Serpula lacrymans var. lacrymans S7.9]